MFKFFILYKEHVIRATTETPATKQELWNSGVLKYTQVSPPGEPSRTLLAVRSEDL